MMAHEVPLQVHQNNMAPPKTGKHKPASRAKAQLPNGEKPNFGAGKEKAKARAPQLPNGERPDFGQGKKELKPNAKAPKKPVAKKNGNAEKKADGRKPEGSDSRSAPRPISSGSAKQSTYAGSSFHSSPEALALPKPSFVSAPAVAQPAAAPFSPEQRAPQTARNIVNLPPSFVYQGGSPAAPPAYPVTAYPPGGHPGFNYNANKQGFINYSYPPTAVAQPPLPMQAYPFQYAPVPPMHHYAHPQQLQSQPHAAPHSFVPNQVPQPGHRITFNELMGSSK